MKSDMKMAGLLGVGTLLVIFCGWMLIEPWKNALQWLLQASLLWYWVWREAWRRCELNRSDANAPLLSRLGWANRLTLLRGYLIALTGGFLFQPQAEGLIGWMPGLLYGAAAILDRLDGFVARQRLQTTLLGAELDTVFDALGLLVAPLLAVTYGKVHWSYLLLSGAYYLFQWGLVWRRHSGLPVYSMMPSQLRRTLAGFQMGFIGLALLPLFQVPQALMCSLAFMVPALLGFVVDWLVVSGRINGQSITVQRFFAGFANLSVGVFQPALRVFIVIGVFVMARQMELSLSLTDSNFLLSLGLLLGASLVLTGLAGRIGALVILLLLGSHVIPIHALSIEILCGAVWLLLLGTGRFSLWQWDDVWVNRQDGA